MATVEMKRISLKLDSLLDFVRPHMSFLNCHMVDFITEKLWVELPENLCSELFSLSDKDVYEVIWNCGANTTNLKKSSNICEFLKECRKMSLESETFIEVVESLETLQGKMAKLNSSVNSSYLTCVPHCMSPKKFHEVEIFVGIVATTAKLCGSSYIVDVGGGKGYLGSCLALHQDLRVLSVDSREENTTGALQLSKKFQDFQKMKGKDTEQKHNINIHCRQATAFVSSNTDLAHMVQKYFPDFDTEPVKTSVPTEIEEVKTNKPEICLAGLHTCGDLAPSSLRLFCANKDIKSICNVGCCYNLLTEGFQCDCGSELVNDTKHSCHGFPMSTYLKQKKFVLGRNARMLAAQAIHRITQKKLVMPNSLFYRAVLQVHLKKLFGLNRTFNVGKISSKGKSLDDYLFKCQQKLKLDMKLDEKVINELKNETLQYRSCMEISYAIRVSLAPVVEAMILLDRLLFLYEQGMNHVFLAQVFNPIISPRSFAIIAMKT